MANKLFIFMRFRWQPRAAISRVRWSPNQLTPPLLVIIMNPISEATPFLRLHLLSASHLLTPVTIRLEPGSPSAQAGNAERPPAGGLNSSPILVSQSTSCLPAPALPLVSTSPLLSNFIRGLGHSFDQSPASSPSKSLKPLQAKTRPMPLSFVV